MQAVFTYATTRFIKPEEFIYAFTSQLDTVVVFFQEEFHPYNRSGPGDWSNRLIGDIERFGRIVKASRIDEKYRLILQSYKEPVSPSDLEEFGLDKREVAKKVAEKQPIPLFPEDRDVLHGFVISPDGRILRIDEWEHYKYEGAEEKEPDYPIEIHHEIDSLDLAAFEVIIGLIQPNLTDFYKGILKKALPNIRKQYSQKSKTKSKN